MLAVGSQIGCRWNGVHTSGTHLLSISALAPETPFFLGRSSTGILGCHMLYHTVEEAQICIKLYIKLFELESPHRLSNSRIQWWRAISIS